jgi:hypothetical protein
MKVRERSSKMLEIKYKKQLQEANMEVETGKIILENTRSDLALL